MQQVIVPVLAHAGGFSWDEALLVMAPIAGVAGVLFLANSRAKKLGRDADPGGTGPEPASRDDAVGEDAVTGDATDS